MGNFVMLFGATGSDRMPKFRQLSTLGQPTGPKCGSGSWLEASGADFRTLGRRKIGTLANGCDFREAAAGPSEAASAHLRARRGAAGLRVGRRRNGFGSHSNRAASADPENRKQIRPQWRQSM
jgi:hypothetical protein